MVAPDVLAGLLRSLGDMPLPVAARELAAAGVPVFPCWPGEKNPMIKAGLLGATTNPRQVWRWWRGRPNANIAIATGAASGLVVIDVDVHGVNGYAAYARAARAGLIPAPLATVTTPTGGRHVYFPAHPAREQRSWGISKVGIDCRGDGGYIIAPPSMLRLDGARVPYRIEHVTTGEAIPVDTVRLRNFLAPLPPRRPTPPGERTAERKDADRLAGWLARQGTGGRNNALFRLACLMAERNLPRTEAVDAFLAAAQPDFGEPEITRTVHSAYRRVGAGTTRREPSTAGTNALVDGFARRDSPARAPASRGLA